MLLRVCFIIASQHWDSDLLMKFFTREWWDGGSENAVAVFQKYADYLKSVEEKLPPQLLELEAEYTLHDSEVKYIRSNFEEQAVSMVLHGWDQQLQNPIRYTLYFSGVTSFEQVLPQQEYVESELGDLGYWECELLEFGVEVRMLFVSYATFRIVFKGFGFEHASRDV
jgi:hypothetical protein